MSGTDTYCRDIESYLCRKNDGHLVRIVGPAFEMVSRWAAQGVPLKVACAGIDRYFERYYRRGPRRRPVRVEFCHADVLDMFDDWRRAVGVNAEAAEDTEDTEDAEQGTRAAEGTEGTEDTEWKVRAAQSTEDAEQGTRAAEDAEDTERNLRAAEGTEDAEQSTRATEGAERTNKNGMSAARARRGASLASHLERVMTQLTLLRSSGARDLLADDVLGEAVRALDRLRADAKRARGEARDAIVADLSAIERTLVEAAEGGLDAEAFGRLDAEAELELAPFRPRMSRDAYERARRAARGRLVRERFLLPRISYE